MYRLWQCVWMWFSPSITRFFFHDDVDRNSPLLKVYSFLITFVDSQVYMSNVKITM